MRKKISLLLVCMMLVTIFVGYLSSLSNAINQQNTIGHGASDNVLNSVQTKENIRLLADSPWWNTNWSFCRVLPIIDPSPSYQMKIVVSKSSGGDVNCLGHCKNDFSDIRFVDVDNNTVLSYWLENFSTGVQATFWVKLPTDVETDGAILLYYGNQAAFSLSNGSDTFLTFINDISGWTGHTQMLSMSDGRIRIYSEPSGYTIYHPISTAGNPDIIVEAKIEEIRIPEFNEYYLDFMITDGPDYRYSFTDLLSASDNNGYFYTSVDGSFTLYFPWAELKNREWREVVKTSISKTDYYLFEENGSLLGSMIDSSYTYLSPVDVTHIGFGTSARRGVNAYISWIKVRKYTSVVPFLGVPGEEQSYTLLNKPPIADFTYSPVNPLNASIVHFVDTSFDTNGTIVSWWWDFGDHYFSDLQHPIHCYYVHGIYNVTLKVTDNDRAYSVIQKIVVPSNPPQTPTTPSGLNNVFIGTTCNYTTSTTDTDDDYVQYRFDWDASGSHNYSAWTNLVPSGQTVTMSHPWNRVGTYLVKSQARDEHGRESSWSNGLSVTVYQEQLDQQQTQATTSYSLYGYYSAAQSFKPTFSKLTKVLVYVNKAGSPTSNLVVSVRSQLNGPILGSASKTPAQIPSGKDWVEFDFGKISVTPNLVYYIVIEPSGYSQYNCYNWWYITSDKYPGGSYWESKQNPPYWTPFIYRDFAFKTYGQNV